MVWYNGCSASSNYWVDVNWWQQKLVTLKAVGHDGAYITCQQVYEVITGPNQHYQMESWPNLDIVPDPSYVQI